MLKSPSTTRAFSLIELVLTVLIIGIIGAIAIPRLSAFAVNAAYISTADQLNHFDTAFNLYHYETGTWPADRLRGVVPPEMIYAGLLKSTDFDGKPLGGDYDWQNWDDGSNGPAGVYLGISSPTDQANLLHVDEMIDDGDLTTGIFYKHSDNWTLLVMQR